MLMLDSHERRSFDSKGQQIHRSAMHVKNSGVVSPKGGHNDMLGGGLHAHKNATNDNHYLPNISSNYTNTNGSAAISMNGTH